MQHSILIKSQFRKNINFLYECFYLFFFLSPYFILNHKIFQINFLWKNIFLIYNFNDPFFMHFENKFSLLLLKFHCDINPTKQLLPFDKRKIFSTTTITSHPHKFITLYNILVFNTSWIIDYSTGNSYFYPMLIKLKKITPLFNAYVFLKKWADTTNFLTNFFCFNPTLLVFSTPFLKQETLALNWFYNNFELNFWRLHSNLFFRHRINFNHKLEYFYRRLYEWDYEVAVLTDINFHTATLFYLNQFYFFSIALIDVSFNPLKVSFPIVILQVNHLIQFFFLKLLIQTYRLANSIQHNYFMKFWKSFHFLSYMNKYQLD